MEWMATTTTISWMLFVAFLSFSLLKQIKVLCQTFLLASISVNLFPPILWLSHYIFSIRQFEVSTFMIYLLFLSLFALIVVVMQMRKIATVLIDSICREGKNDDTAAPPTPVSMGFTARFRFFWWNKSSIVCLCVYWFPMRHVALNKNKLLLLDDDCSCSY